MILNSLERSLVEKAGYENGWELAAPASEAGLELSSSRHGLSVRIRAGLHSGEWVLGFSSGVPLDELRRDFPEPIFQGNEIRPWDIPTLGAILHRAAELGSAIPDKPLAIYLKEVEAEIEKMGITPGTEAERLVRQRIGQDRYREAQIQYWKGACAVTGVEISEVLRASHSKPWALCESDSERLNVYNGFLLSANLDALFDRGLITFSDTGSLIIASRLSGHPLALLGINEKMKLRWIDKAHLPFLRWHRENLGKMN